MVAALTTIALLGPVAPAAATHESNQSPSYVTATIEPNHRSGVGRSAFIVSPAPTAGRWSFKVAAPAGKISSVTIKARLCTQNTSDHAENQCYDPTGNGVSISRPTGGEVLVTKKVLPAPGAEYADYKYYYVKMWVQGTAGSSITAHICPPPTPTKDCTFVSS